MYKELIKFIKNLYCGKKIIPLHEPYFDNDEKELVLKTIESTYVSSIGPNIDEFENQVASYTGVKYAIATVNGTSALHASLLISGVKDNDEVITQSMTFVATCNAIRYCNAVPIFIDIDRDCLGLSAELLSDFLHHNCEVRSDGSCWNKKTNRIIRACLPMHSFGLSIQIDLIKKICKEFNIILIEDAAESLGTTYNGDFTGSIGDLGVLSFNGNKIITTGGGGMILTNNKGLAAKARHITTTAKLKHKWNFVHDITGYNYRMPSINAALGIAQLRKLNQFIKSKRKIAHAYHKWGADNEVKFVIEVPESRSNYWLNTIITKNQSQRDLLLEKTNSASIMTRPSWTPMHQLELYKCYQTHSLENTDWASQRIINLPSSVNYDN